MIFGCVLVCCLLEHQVTSIAVFTLRNRLYGVLSVRFRKNFLGSGNTTPRIVEYLPPLLLLCRMWQEYRACKCLVKHLMSYVVFDLFTSLHGNISFTTLLPKSDT